MSVPRPHFLLFSDAKSRSQHSPQARGSWRFVLEAVDGDEVLQAEDVESETSSDRLALLAVVRGLEALDQPSRVTLVTNNRYVARGLRFGLREWRENQWRWEQFGQMTPIPNGDLWQRVDGALQYHRVECRAVEMQWQDERASAPATSTSARRVGRPPVRRGVLRQTARVVSDRIAALHSWWTSAENRSASHAAC